MATLPDLIFAAQSATLRVWCGTLREDDLKVESALPAWTIAHLLNHLAHVQEGVAALQAVTDPAADPLSVADFTARYGADGDAGPGAHPAAMDAGPGLDGILARWDRAAAGALGALGALGAADRLVTTPRGPMLLSNYLTTRVVELVVHADDMQRALPDRPAPVVLPAARRHVVTALREVLTDRRTEPEILVAASELDEGLFLDLATGRRRPGPDVPAALAEALPLW